MGISPKWDEVKWDEVVCKKWDEVGISPKWDEVKWWEKLCEVKTNFPLRKVPIVEIFSFRNTNNFFR